MVLRYLAYTVGAVLLLFFLWIWLVWPPPIWYRWTWPRETSFMAMRRHEAEERVNPTMPATSRYPSMRSQSPYPLR